MAIPNFAQLERVDLGRPGERGRRLHAVVGPGESEPLGRHDRHRPGDGSTEKDVGPFRADILCKDTATGDWVLIENQIERTDHTHLGQLLTYAAGLKAVTVVWIAEQFNEQHRAASDWLNEITGEPFSFFGLEIELWRIAGSPIAPKFNAVCKVNDWKKPPPPPSGDPTEIKLLQQEYWANLRSLLLERKSVVKPQKPLPQHWTNFGVGKSYFGLFASVNTRRRASFRSA